MTKSEFVDRLSRKNDISKNEAEKILNAILDSVEDALAQDGKIVLKSFGVMDVVERKAREGRNPATGEAVQIPAQKSVRFRAGEALKKALNPEK